MSGWGKYDPYGAVKKAEEDIRRELGKVTEPIKEAWKDVTAEIPALEQASDWWSGIYEKTTKTGETLSRKAGDWAASPEGAMILGALATGGSPVGAMVGAGAGYASTTKGVEEIRNVGDKITEGVDALKNITIGGKTGEGAGGPSIDEALNKLGSGGATGTGFEGIAGGLQTIKGIKNPVFNPTFTDIQQGLAGGLQDRVSGKTPSLAELQQKQASNKAMLNTLGAVRAGVGSNAALTARTAALAGGQQMAEVANQSATLRLKEQQDAQSALANLAAQGNTATQAQQQLLLEAGKANQAAQLSQLQMQNQAGMAEMDARAKILSAALAGQGNAGGGGTNFWDILFPIAGATIGTMVGGAPGGAAGTAAGKAAADMTLTNPTTPTIPTLAESGLTPEQYAAGRHHLRQLQQDKIREEAAAKGTPIMPTQAPTEGGFSMIPLRPAEPPPAEGAPTPTPTPEAPAPRIMPKPNTPVTRPKRFEG
jgi:hypothetical protein